MITFRVECPDHGDVNVEADDMLIAFESFLVHCPEVDHLFLQTLTPRVENALVVCGVERLGP